MKKFNITVNGTAYEVEVEEVKAAGAAPLTIYNSFGPLVA